jgi:hypothetical protein
MLITDRKHDGQTDGSSQTIASSYSISEAKHICWINPKLADGLCIGTDCHEVLGDIPLTCSLTDEPCASTMSVGHGLLSGECLGGNEE